MNIKPRLHSFRAQMISSVAMAPARYARMDGSGGGAGGGAGGGTPAPVDYGAVYATLNPENKTFFETKGFNKSADGKPIDVNGLLDWGRNAEKMIGNARLPAPRLDDDAELAKWTGWKELGTPEKPDDYKFERPKMPDGVPYDEEAEKSLRVALHKAHVPAKLANRIYSDLMALRLGEVTKMQQLATEAKTAMETELRTAWGGAYDAKIGDAKLALAHVSAEAGIDASKALDGIVGALGNSAAVKLFAWLKTQFAEGVIKGGGGNSGFANGPDAAKAEIGKLRTDKEFMAAYTTKNHPGHSEAVKRMNRLHEQAEAGK